MAVFKRKYTARNGQAKTIQKYSVEFRDHNDIVRRVSGFSDKSASSELERQLKKLVALRMAGSGPDAELSRFLESCPGDIRERLAEWGIIATERAAMGKALTAHIEAWGRHLEARQCAPRHCSQAITRVKKIFAGCRIFYWTDIRAEKVETWLADLRRDGVGNRTSNSYLSSAKAFCAWMEKSGYVSENPLSRLSNLNEGIDRRHERRPLETDEIGRLVGTVQASDAILWGMKGRDREILYRVALGSGLRWGELKSLSRASFDLSGTPPTVTVSAGAAKNRRSDTIPLQPELAKLLAEYFRQTPGLPLSPAFPMPKSDRGADILGHDLEAAGIAKTDDFGRVVDFHSLRHSFITNLAKAGVHPKIAQDLARHSTIELTMRNYTHTRLESRMEALARLPEIVPATPEEKESVAKTGTDDLLDESAAKTIVMKVDSFSADSTDKIKTYSDNEKVVYMGGLCGGENEKSPVSQGVSGLSNIGIPTGNRTPAVSLKS